MSNSRSSPTFILSRTIAKRFTQRAERKSVADSFRPHISCCLKTSGSCWHCRVCVGTHFGMPCAEHLCIQPSILITCHTPFTVLSRVYWRTCTWWECGRNFFPPAENYLRCFCICFHAAIFHALAITTQWCKYLERGHFVVLWLREMGDQINCHSLIVNSTWVDSKGWWIILSPSLNQMARLATFKDIAAHGVSGKCHQTTTLHDLTTWRHTSP